MNGLKAVLAIHHGTSLESRSMEAAPLPAGVGANSSRSYPNPESAEAPMYQRAWRTGRPRINYRKTLITASSFLIPLLVGSEAIGEPKIEVRPLFHHFGDVVVGSSSELEIEVKNVGSTRLSGAVDFTPLGPRIGGLFHASFVLSSL